MLPRVATAEGGSSAEDRRPPGLANSQVDLRRRSHSRRPAVADPGHHRRAESLCRGEPHRVHERHDHRAHRARLHSSTGSSSSSTSPTATISCWAASRRTRSSRTVRSRSRCIRRPSCWGSPWYGRRRGRPGRPALLLDLDGALFSMLFCMVINVTIEYVGYRPLRNQPRLAPLITAIGFSFLLQNIGLVWKDAGPQPGRPPPEGNIIDVSGISYSWADFMVLMVTLPLLIALTYLVRSTRSGKAMRATAQDMDAAAMMGINVKQDDLVHVRARRGAGRRGRRHLHAVLRHVEVRPRLPARPLRVHRGSSRRHRQPHRRRSWRALARAHPGVHRRLHRRALDDDGHLLDPHPHPRVPAVGLLGEQTPEASDEPGRTCARRRRPLHGRPACQEVRARHSSSCSSSFPLYATDRGAPLEFFFVDFLGMDIDTVFQMAST